MLGMLFIILTLENGPGGGGGVSKRVIFPLKVTQLVMLSPENVN